MHKTICMSGLLVFHLTFAQNTILWSIKKPNSDSVSYILGTYHQMGNSFIDSKPSIKELLKKSEVAVFEAVEDKDVFIENNFLQRKDDFSFQDNLDKKDVVYLQEASASWKIPLSKLKPLEALAKLRQEFIKKNCGTIQVSDTIDHMDDYLLSMAKDYKIQVLGLETYENQIVALNNNGLTWDRARSLVHERIKELTDKKNRDKICALAYDYMNFKLDYQLNKKCNENDKLIIDRNLIWLPKIKEIISSHKTVFLAVGLFHLFGECGIITELKKEGFEVEPVFL